jgi:hypothetical protein
MSKSLLQEFSPLRKTSGNWGFLMFSFCASKVIITGLHLTPDSYIIQSLILNGKR